MLQKVTPNANDSTSARILPLREKIKQRRLTDQTPETLSPLHIAKRKGPEFDEAATFTAPKDYHQEFVRCMNEYYSWFFSRVIASSGDKAFPGIGGFISLTGTTPPRKTHLDYYTVIPQPITRYETVKELLEQSAEVTSVVEQKYTINTLVLL